jgi:DNA-directed RNA polymerase subunit alpha
MAHDKRYDLPIEWLNLSVRAYYCLKRAGVATVGEAMGMSEAQLLSIRNFGRRSYDELRARIIELSLREPPDEEAPA